MLRESSLKNLMQQQRSSTLHLVRLAIDLGAADFGGPLTPAEHEIYKKATELPPPTQEELNLIRGEVLAGNDPMGQAFTRVVSPEDRRPLGAVYTPAAIVKPMVSWVMNRRPSRVVDPGAGSGRFSLQLALLDPQLDIVAIDLDPVATLICRANLRMAGAANVRVIQGDYLDLNLPPSAGRTAFIGNPPYVRHHDLAPKVKERTRKLASALGRTVSGLAGLHVHFFIATALYARTGDIGCFVTSSEWLDVGYGAIMRDLLANDLGLQSLHLLDPTSTPFEDAMTTAVISCFEVGKEPKDVALRLVHEPNGFGALDTMERKTASGQLKEMRRWSCLFGATIREEESKGDMVPLGTLVRVRRGVATGANEFFVMTAREAEWRGLSRFARPAVTRAQEVFSAGEIIRAHPGRKVIIDLPGDLDLGDPELNAVRTFIAEGENRGIHQRYLCEHRKPWWRLGIGQAPRVVATYMARQAPAFALNPDELVLLNVAHGFHPRAPLTDEDLLALVRYLNKERISHRGKGRTYHGGLEKFEPREMEALLIPPLHRLHERMKQTI